jgi:hypothetical protein
MAARQTNDPDRGNLQVIVVNLNGNNQTLQDALRTVHDMIRRDTPPTARQPQINGKGKAKALTNGKNGEGEPAATEAEQSLFVDPIVPPSEDEQEANENRTTPAGATKKSKPTIPKVVVDLDLTLQRYSFFRSGGWRDRLAA